MEEGGRRGILQSTALAIAQPGPESTQLAHQGPRQADTRAPLASPGPCTGQWEEGLPEPPRVARGGTVGQYPPVHQAQYF